MAVMIEEARAASKPLTSCVLSGRQIGRISGFAVVGFCVLVMVMAMLLALDRRFHGRRRSAH